MARRKVTSERRDLPAEDERRRAEMAGRIEREEADTINEWARAVYDRHQRLRAFVAALKAERERQRISLTEMSRRTGIDKANLSRLETDARAKPTIGTLERLAAALGKRVRLELVDEAA